MIYQDDPYIRLQKSNLRYCILGEIRLIHRTKTKMHLEFPDNKPIGPTMLVEWTDER